MFNNRFFPIKNSSNRYNHADWEFRRWICRFLMRHVGFTILAKVERVDGLENVPADGPAIMMMNHIAFIDPLVMVHIAPRNIVPLAKEEAYKIPVVGIFPWLWGAIPVRRDGVDRRAVQQALEVLRAGEILLVAPEATRNRTLQNPREGAVYLASRSGAPIIPVALEGTKGFPSLPFHPRWRHPGVCVRFGPPFRIRSAHRNARGEQLEQMSHEAMYALASILPDHRRGVYADFSKATQEMIEWI